MHGEVTAAEVDVFDREAVFITEKLIPILDKVPELRVRPPVMSPTHTCEQNPLARKA